MNLKSKMFIVRHRREYRANKNNLQDQLSSIEKDAKEMGQDKA